MVSLNCALQSSGKNLNSKLVDQRVIKTTIDTYDLMAEEYASCPFASNPDIDELGFFEEHVNDLGRRILDIGCAYGRDADYFRRRNFEVTAIDLSKKLLTIARATVPGVDFRLMDMRDLRFPDNFFDGVWVDTAFLHIPKVEAKSTLEGFHKVLKHGGTLFITIHGSKEDRGIIMESFGPDEELIATPDFGLDKLMFFAYYESDEFQKLLHETGFEVIKSVSKQDARSRLVYLNFFATALK